MFWKRRGNQVQGFFFGIISDGKDDITKSWQSVDKKLQRLYRELFQSSIRDITSPVDFISGPDKLSTLASLVKEDRCLDMNTGAFRE